MRKYILSLFVIVFLLASLATVCAGDVAYITKGSVDNNLLNSINELGYSINYIDNSEIATTNFSEYDMLLVPDESFRDYVDDIPVNEINAVILNSYYMDEWNWVTDGVYQISSNQPLEAEVLDSNLRITQGVSELLKVYTQGTSGGVGIPIYFLSKNKKAAGLKGAVSPEGNSYDFLIAKAQEGTALKNGEISHARTVFFGITESEFWTNESERLFKNSLQWVMEGDDFDGDGFRSDVDCDDHDATVNPNATEIPYDGIDNDCKDGDLTDVDEDGFDVDCSFVEDIPCLVVGGTDCDDTLESYNPNSTDSTRNCVNEAPIFSGNISNISWKEDGISPLLYLGDYFTDPDGDELTFNVSSTSKDKNVTIMFLTSSNRVLRFSSTENWNGEDWVVFYATDGKINTTTNNITLIVEPVNDAPILDEIDPIIRNETDIIEFNVSASDVDKDSLTYYANDLPEGATFVNQTFSWVTNYSSRGIYFVRINVTDGEFWDSKEIGIRIDNNNRAPILEHIQNQTIEEDNSKTIFLNASDPDEEDLEYSVISKNTSEVDCEINENNGELEIAPYLNWNGNATCEVEVRDGDLTDTQSFNIIVTPVNDAPVLEKINDINAQEEDLITIIATAQDVEEDALIFSINDSRFDSDNGTFTWQTEYTDFGTYYVNVSVSDGEFEDFQIVEVEITNQNQLPVINPISDINIEEDSGVYFPDEEIDAYDLDGYITKFEVAQENLNEVDCKVSGNDLAITPSKDFAGSASCTIRAYDNEGSYGEGVVNIIVNNINDAPKIVSFSPEFLNPVITEYGEVNFEIEWEDVDDNNVDIEWHRDNNKIWIGEDYIFMGDGSVGEYSIKAIVSDGEENDSVEWTLRTTNVPIAEGFDGETTKFDGMDENDLGSIYLVLEKEGFGKIEFLEPIDLRDVADLSNYADISNGLCGIDSNVYNVFKGKNARITFYNLDFNKTPTIYYNSGFALNPLSITQICPDTICSEIDYNNEKLSFVVKGFSSFMAGDTLTCEQQNGNICTENEVCKSSFIDARDSNVCCPTECVPYFKDAETCDVINDNVKIKIKEPDKGEDFQPGEIINIEVEIENNFEDKHEFDVEVSFYDLSEGDSVEDEKENVKIESDETETIEFEIKIPEDIDDSDDFYIFVNVKDEDNESLCNEESIQINIEREDNDVIVKNLDIIPLIVSSGGLLDVKVEVQNIGSDEQEDVYILLENIELNISKKSEKFDIEEFDEDDSERVSFSVRIPEGVEEKAYELKATVFFDDEDMEYSKIETFNVINDVFSLDSQRVLSLVDVDNPIIYLTPLVATENPDALILESTDRDDAIVLEKNSIVLDEKDDSILLNSEDNGDREMNLPSLNSMEDMILISLIVGIIVILIIIFVVAIVRRL